MLGSLLCIVALMASACVHFFRPDRFWKDVLMVVAIVFGLVGLCLLS